MKFALFLLFFFPLLVFAKKDVNSNLSSIQIGMTEPKMMEILGKHNFNDGGPDIPRTHAYEVVGEGISAI